MPRSDEDHKNVQGNQCPMQNIHDGTRDMLGHLSENVQMQGAPFDKLRVNSPEE
jgi:hypothetical protein